MSAITQTETYFSNKIPSIHETANTPLYDLQEVIQQYQSQPELLKLILTSKVEEDKRRAEEAKLRAKELDIYLQHNNSSTPNSPPTTPLHHHQKSTGKILSTPKKKNLKGTPYSHNKFRSYHSSISSGSSISSLSDEDIEEDTPVDQHHQQRRHSAAAAMLAMGNVATVVPEESNNKEEVISSAYPSPVADHYNSDEQEDFGSNKPRRRREMQAITKIVETREFPYVDNYFWKNNGNTVQKKTGCKSIYYKCSNSNKVIIFFWEFNGIWRGGEASLPDLLLVSDI
jgi:hypothetical protein